MEATNNLVCQLCSAECEDWKRLYESAFALGEKMPVEEILELIKKGSMQLHKTINKDGELLCFSLCFFPPSDFVFLSYIATDSTKRSGGYGSRHMKQLVEQMKSKFPNHLGLFLEIQSTKESGLDAETQKARNRRLAFYQRLGARRLCKSYLVPPVGGLKGPPHECELLWIEFGNRTIDDVVLQRVIGEIYQHAYSLPLNDPLVSKVLGQFTGASGPSICPPAAVPASSPQDAGGATSGVKVGADGAGEGKGTVVGKPAAARENVPTST